MNWWLVLLYVGYLVGGLIVISMVASVIVNALIRLKKAGSYRVEIFVPDLAGFGGGTVRASFDTKAELDAFVKDFDSKKAVR